MEANELHCYHLYSPGLFYPAVPAILHKDDLASYTGFASVYAVSKADAEAIQQAGTAKGFKGVVWSERLWLDFDSYEAGERAQSKLKEMGYDHVVYNTGGRGYHIGILRVAHPSHLLPAQDKQWVLQHFPEADPRLYTHLHLFRLPGTKHCQTGRIKTLVSTYSGRHINMSSLHRSLQTIECAAAETFSVSVFNCSRVMHNSMPVEEGNRHAQLVTLAYALRDDAEATKQFALLWVEQVNLAFHSPKEYIEVVQIVNSVYGE